MRIASEQRTRILRILVCAALAAIFIQATQAHPRTLTFEQRVRAQETIERFYHARRIGAARPFEEAVPRAVLEKKVRTYLKESAALDTFWRTPVTGDLLRRELERMAGKTRMPDRLREIYAVLGNDPFLIQESLARPALVDRLARNLFAYDATIHAKARREAEILRDDLARGRLDPRSRHPRRTVAELVRVETAGGTRGSGEGLPPGMAMNGEPFRLELQSDAFKWYRSQLPARVGDIGPVLEGREAFLVRVVLNETKDAIEVATFVAPKRSWEEWWASVEGRLAEESVGAVALEQGTLPLPPSDESVGRAGTACLPANSWDSVDSGGGEAGYTPEPRSRHTAIWTGSLMVVWGGFGTYGDLGTGGRYDPALDAWTPTSTTNAPLGRSGHTAIWTGSLMVVWGGSDYLGKEATGGRYDPATDTWAPATTTNAPSARSGHTAIWTGSRMVVWGGTDSSSGYPRTGGRYDPATDTWTETSMANAPSGRRDHTSVWTGSHMIVWGGFDSTYPSTGGQYDPATDAWSPIDMFGPSGRRGHTAVWTGSHMIVWGGESSFGFFTDGGRYNPASDTWAPTSTTNAPSGRSGHTAVWTGTSMVVWGGSNGSDLNTGGRYDPATDTWAPTSSTNAPSARYQHTGVWTGSLMVVWGGLHGNNQVDTGSRYDPATDSWTLATYYAPLGRRGHTAVWTGTLMIVWGGYGFDTPYATGILNTGVRYDPLTDTWTATSRSSPSVGGRYNHTAVWTGNEMIVWGGFGGRPLNTGGRYDPVADTWTPTSTTNAPSARILPTAVWTGSLMIVWGGSNFYQLNTGGRYDPSTDTWMPTSTGENVPDWRFRHTAIWTGNRMIVWGGYAYDPIHDISVLSNTGGLYDPATDAWTRTSTGNAPSARVDHSAVWTGSHMVVWGGSDWDGFSTTGGRYDPATNTWARTTPTNAPSARSSQTAVWTGDFVVVWGGFGLGGIVNTGGRYDPDTDSWTATCTTNAPSARINHTAVWTGTHMIVWGGYNGSGYGYLNTGGRYAAGPGVDGDGDCFSECQGDCDDGNAAVHPGAGELCDGLDNDCDGNVDGLATMCGVGECVATGFCAAGVDSCVPGAPSAELCDGVDNDCDGVVDNNPTDADADGFKWCQDCNDNNAAVHPGATELCDGLDNDCNGSVDGFATSCGVGQCFRTGSCAAGVNSCVPGPASAEICDGVDNNCDGPVDNVPIPTGSPAVAMDLSAQTPQLAWEPLPDATGYDVVRGDLGTLLGTGGDFTSAVAGCSAFHIGENSLPLAEDPGPGAASFYLVRGVNCVGAGTYDSGDPAQVGLRDAEINISPLACSWCGDGVCNNGETCATCLDCGYCPTCATDYDCQPADCCHATSCIFVWETQSCHVGICDGCSWPEIGCGYYCACQNGTCVAAPG